MSDQALRLVIIDDHALIRAGIRAELPDDMVVVAEADDVASGVQAIHRIQGGDLGARVDCATTDEFGTRSEHAVHRIKVDSFDRS